MIFWKPIQEGNFKIYLDQKSLFLKLGLKNTLEDREVEHHFSGGLSKRLTLKFSWQPPNFMTFFNQQDFRLGGKGTRFS